MIFSYIVSFCYTGGVHSFQWKPFLLVEVIVFIDFVVFKDHLITMSGYLFIYVMCRSSILK